MSRELSRSHLELMFKTQAKKPKETVTQWWKRKAAPAILSRNKRRLTIATRMLDDMDNQLEDCKERHEEKMKALRERREKLIVEHKNIKNMFAGLINTVMRSQQKGMRAAAVASKAHSENEDKQSDINELRWLLGETLVARDRCVRRIGRYERLAAIVRETISHESIRADLGELLQRHASLRELLRENKIRYQTDVEELIEFTKEHAEIYSEHKICVLKRERVLSKMETKFEKIKKEAKLQEVVWHKVIQGAQSESLGLGCVLYAIYGLYKKIQDHQMCPVELEDNFEMLDYICSHFLHMRDVKKAVLEEMSHDPDHTALDLLATPMQRLSAEMERYRRLKALDQSSTSSKTTKEPVISVKLETTENKRKKKGSP